MKKEGLFWFAYVLIVVCVYFWAIGKLHAQDYLYCTESAPVEDVVTAYHVGGQDAADKAVSAAMLRDDCYLTPDRLRYGTVVREPSLRVNNIVIQAVLVSDNETSLWTVVVKDDGST